MIIDRIENAHLYYGLGPHIDAALKYIHEEDLSRAGSLTLDDGNVKVSRTVYVSRPMEQCKKENHRAYADIHVCLEGVEIFGYSNLRDVTPVTEYDAIADKQFFDGKMSYTRLLPGMFALALTEDVHSAMMMEDAPAPAQKLIIKCKL